MFVFSMHSLKQNSKMILVMNGVVENKNLMHSNRIFTILFKIPSI